MKECIIIAGGLGSRLGAIASEEPKCLIQILGKPFIEYLFDFLAREGIEHVILSLGYGAAKVSAWIEAKKLPFEISVLVEKEQLGTGGAIKNAISAVRGNFTFVMNGDTLFKIDTNAMLHLHDKKKADITIALKPMTNIERYGSVTMNGEDRIIRFKEKEPLGQGLINGGVYIINKLIFKDLDKDVFSFEKEVLEHTDDHKIFGYVDDSYFIDIGTPEDYKKAAVDFLKF